MIKQKNLNKIVNNNNINTKTTTKTNIKQNLLLVYVTSLILILAFSIFSIQTGLAQQQQQFLDENKANNVSFITNNTNITSFTDENEKPIHVPNQIVVVAEDIKEIRDNLQEARKSLNNANYLQVLSHINNIDKLLTAFAVSGSLTDDVNNNLTSSNISTDSTALAHLSNSYLIKEYNELIKDYNEESKKEKVIN
jgi:cell division protein FtsI/penicillin-binding protein 2